MARLKISKTYNGITIDANVSPTLVNGNVIGGTGGNTTITGQQLQPMVFITGGSQVSGNILHQKGAHKFRVWDGTRIGTCTLANTATLSAGQMNLTITVNTFVNANIAAANVVGGATTTYMSYLTGNISGPVPVDIGDPVIGFAGNAVGAYILAINPTVAGVANLTISTTGNVAAQTATANTSVYASRITNKFVYDFDGDKFRYHLFPCDSTFVQVSSS
jgi:hypothetical protein